MTFDEDKTDKKALKNALKKEGYSVSAVKMLDADTLAARASLVKIEPIENESGNLVAFYINPKKLKIDKNTIVIWLSEVPGQEIQVAFENGKACMDVTADPYGFSMEDKSCGGGHMGCYVTNYIPFGATSSLRFTESGTFDYLVRTEDGKLKFKGKLIVY